MEIKRKIKDTLFDNTDLELAHQEIGYLKDLCDAKDNVIAYQKELLNIQGESLKHFRQIEEAYNKLGQEHIELNKRLEELESKSKRKKKNENIGM